MSDNNKEQKKEIIIFNDGSWQAKLLLEEKRLDKTKTVKEIEVSMPINNGELESLQDLNLDETYLSKIQDKLEGDKNKPVYICLHFSTEDYAKLNLDNQINILRGKYPKMKVLHGYRFHNKDKLRKIKELGLLKPIADQTVAEAKEVTMMDKIKENKDEAKLYPANTGIDEEGSGTDKNKKQVKAKKK